MFGFFKFQSRPEHKVYVRVLVRILWVRRFKARTAIMKPVFTSEVMGFGSLWYK